MNSYQFKKINQKITARYFLIEALRYYKKGNDFSYLIALCLAGISEELIGQMLKKTRKKNSLEMEKKGYGAIVNILYKQKKSDKDLSTFLNKAKNIIKHDAGTLYLDPKVEATDMLNRAIKNFEIYFTTMLEKPFDFNNASKESLKKLIKSVSKVKIDEKIQINKNQR